MRMVDTFVSKGERTMDVSMGDQTGAVGPGDHVLVRGWYAPVEQVVIHGPGQHADSPIVNEMYAVEAITNLGSRWAGGTSARIGGDLLAHWER